MNATIRLTSIVVLSLAACSHKAPPAPDAGTPDLSATFDASMPVDASATPDAAMCNLAAPFGTPTLIAELDSPDDDEWPSLTPDELTIFFSSQRGHVGTGDIWTATRASIDAPFGTPSMVADVSTGSNEYSPFISADARSLYFTRSEQLYLATRASVGDSFGDDTELTGLGTATSVTPSLTQTDPVQLFFYVDAAQQIYVATEAAADLATGAVFDAASELTDFMGDMGNGTAGGPYITPDGLTLYIGGGSGGLGAADIYVAKRSTPTGHFEDLTDLTSVNSASDDYAPWASADGCHIYFTSRRTGADGGGGADLYYAARPQ